MTPRAPDAMEKTCENCKYHHQKTRWEIECHKHAPKVFLAHQPPDLDYNPIYETRFPIVAKTDWCGAWSEEEIGAG